MTPSNASAPQANQAARPNWSAVFAVAFCVACLITVEFLPVSLLTPMAQDLGISEGVAGQSVTTTAFVAMFASLFITSIIRSTDRRYVVILFSVLLTVSCLLVSFANSFSLLLVVRGPFNIVWQRLPNVLEKVGMKVTDSTRSTGSMTATYKPLSDSAWQELGAKDPQLASGDYKIQVGDLDNRSSLQFIDPKGHTLTQSQNDALVAVFQAAFSK